MWEVSSKLIILLLSRLIRRVTVQLIIFHYLLYSDCCAPLLDCIWIYLSNFSTILVQSGVVVGMDA